MYYFVDIVCSVAEIIFLSFLAESFFPRRENHKWVTALAYVVFGLILVGLSLYPELTVLRTVFWVMGGTLLIRILFNTKWLSSLFSCLSFVVICGLTDIVVMVLLSFFGLSNQLLMEEGSSRTLYTIISHLVLLLFVVFIRLVKRHTTNGLSTKVLLPVCPSLLISILFCCLLASEISANMDMNPLYLVIALGLLYTNIIIIFYTTWLQEKENAQRSLEIANHHYAMQKEYYEQFRSQQEQTRALWHDISKYLRAAKVENTSTQSLEQLQEMVDSIAPVVDVNNRVVSIILNEYVQNANQVETRLSLDVQIPPELGITAADLYILLGNTLDNALDACSELPVNDRQISLQLRLHNQMLFYRISNPYNSAHLHRKRNQFHGYGLRNVQECVKRNHGTMEVSTEQNTYTITVHINCT
jgi:hypothetical protein